VVESHVLERNKYQSKFPTIEFKAQILKLQCWELEKKHLIGKDLIILFLTLREIILNIGRLVPIEKDSDVISSGRRYH
jgi:hypothetical protein